MNKKTAIGVCCALAGAAVLLAGCAGRGSAHSGSQVQNSTEQNQQQALRTGLGVIASANALGTAPGAGVRVVAAAVVLDGDGAIVQARVEELYSEVDATAGRLALPASYPTLRQSSAEWGGEADAFAQYLAGKNGEAVRGIRTDSQGYPEDEALAQVSGRRVQAWRDAVAKACDNATAQGAGQGDTLGLGIYAQGTAASAAFGTGEAGGEATLEVSIAAVSCDEAGRVTSAVCDACEIELALGEDGAVQAPGEVRTGLQSGDDYGMRGASALGKEWYEHSAGFASWLKGKTAQAVAAMHPASPGADLLAVCTIDTGGLQKAVVLGMQQAGRQNG